MTHLLQNLLAAGAIPAILAQDNSLALKGFGVVALGIILGIIVVVRPSRRKPDKPSKKRSVL